MKTKLFLTSIVAMCAVAPAFATPTNTSATFPANGYMLEDYTYTNAATSTNMAGVYENSVNADANYGDCPAGYWCDASGQHACSTAGDGSYTDSDDGATENTMCYKSCTIANANIAHATAVTGNDYYGAGTDTCSATSCENGYHINGGTPDLNTIIGTTTAYDSNFDGPKYGYISNSGTYRQNDTTYGLTQNGEFAVEYANNKGIIKGHAQCSSQSGDYNSSNPTITSILPDAVGEYCYCTLDSYTPVGESAIALSGPWLFLGIYYNSASICADSCADHCADILSDAGDSSSLAFRAAVFGAFPPSAASCDANTITINWSGASQSDIDANNAGTVTYGGDIRTPRAAEIIPGKVFVGWKFEVPEVQGGGGK